MSDDTIPSLGVLLTSELSTKLYRLSRYYEKSVYDLLVIVIDAYYRSTFDEDE